MRKTGWTVDSQHTLVSVIRREGTTLIAVVMLSFWKKARSIR